MGAIKRTKTNAGGESWWFWCGPCDTHHRYVTKLGEGETGPCWTFNGDEEHPTFTPSLLCNGSLCQCKKPDCKRDHVDPDHGVNRCHLYLTDGMVKYLGDCSHGMAEKTVPVEPPCF